MGVTAEGEQIFVNTDEAAFPGLSVITPTILKITDTQRE